MRRFFLWCRLLTKRNLRRKGYLAVLLSAPLLALLLSLAAKQGGGLVTVALYREDGEDLTAQAAVGRLLAEDGALRCFETESEVQARAAVASGEADAAWLFLDGAEEAVAEFDALGPPAVHIVEREDTVLLMLAREKLAASLYPEMSFGIFTRYLRALDPDAPDAATLRRYYNAVAVSDPVLEFSFADGGEVADEQFLSAPLRGLLALLVLLAAFASGLYSFREEERESFVWLPGGKRRLLPVLCHLTAVVPAALSALLSLAVAMLLAEPWREGTALLLYCLGCALFGETVRLLCRSERLYAALIPLLLIAALLLSPIFLDLTMLRPLQLVFPPFLYLKAVYRTRWLLLQALQTAAYAVVVLVLSRRRR